MVFNFTRRKSLLLTSLLILLWAVGLIATIWGTWYALKSFQSDLPKPETSFPPVSILKPIKGLEAGLEENLISFFNLKYPSYELLLCVDSPLDPARRLVEDLLTRFPQVDARLVISSREVGKNPKVNNLAKAYEEAKYEAILISDSNVRVASNYLENLLPHLKERVGIVTAVVAGSHSENWGGHLETSYLNTFYARWMQVTRAFGVATVVGKTMLFKRSNLERIGGIQVLACYIAEDYMAGRAMWHLGLKIAVCHQPISQFIGRYSFQNFWSRHLRWGRIRKSHAPFAFAFEPLFMSFVSGILGAWGLSRAGSWDPFLILFFHFLVWFGLDLILMKKMDRLRFPVILAWWVREGIAFPQWIHMAAGNSVIWRGRRLVLKEGGFLGRLGEVA